MVLLPPSPLMAIPEVEYFIGAWAQPFRPAYEVRVGAARIDSPTDDSESVGSFVPYLRLVPWSRGVYRVTGRGPRLLDIVRAENDAVGGATEAAHGAKWEDLRREFDGVAGPNQRVEGDDDGVVIASALSSYLATDDGKPRFDQRRAAIEYITRELPLLLLMREVAIIVRVWAGLPADATVLESAVLALRHARLRGDAHSLNPDFRHPDDDPWIVLSRIAAIDDAIDLIYASRSGRNRSARAQPRGTNPRRDLTLRVYRALSATSMRPDPRRWAKDRLKTPISDDRKESFKLTRAAVISMPDEDAAFVTVANVLQIRWNLARWTSSGRFAVLLEIVSGLLPDSLKLAPHYRAIGGSDRFADATARLIELASTVDRPENLAEVPNLAETLVASLGGPAAVDLVQALLRPDQLSLGHEVSAFLSRTDAFVTRVS